MKTKNKNGKNHYIGKEAFSATDQLVKYIFLLVVKKGKGKTENYCKVYVNYTHTQNQ